MGHLIMVALVVWGQLRIEAYSIHTALLPFLLLPLLLAIKTAPAPEIRDSSSPFAVYRA
jgi:hypothetical protein